MAEHSISPNDPSSDVDDSASIGALFRSSKAPYCVERINAPSGETGCYAQSLLDALGNENVAANAESAAAGVEIQSELTDCLLRLERFEQLSRCPLVAIAGQLNAGKSSLVGTFLSQQARDRIPRGLANNSATHRFVIWLPGRWQSDQELLEALTRTTTELFGSEPTFLPDSLDEAHTSYADASETTPMLAFDSGLDELGLGLIDCPDIQSGFAENLAKAIGKSDVSQTSGHESQQAAPKLIARELPELRRRQLHSIAKLCSAFVVVCGMRNLHDQSLVQILQILRDSLPGVPRYLAVNRVKARYSPEAVIEQARMLSDRFGILETYVAYDYRVAAASARIPSPPANAPASETQQPIFFTQASTTERKTKKTPAFPSPVKYLADLGQDLDAGFLAKESSRSLNLQLTTHTRQAFTWIADNRTANTELLRRLFNDIAEACIAFMAERNAAGVITGLRMQTSPAIINQLTDSLSQTAPGWMQMSMKVDRSARRLQMAIKNSASKLAVLGNVSQSVKNLVRRFKRGEGAEVVTPSKLASAIRHQDRQGATEYLNDEQLAAQCDAAMHRFEKEDQTVLDEHQLEQWSKEVWANMPMRQKLWKGAQPFALLMAPFAAVILLPIDGGGSAVLVFASAKELLAAAGIATLLGPTQTGHLALEVAQGETAWRQLSNLFAICCDSLGIARPNEAGMPEVFDGKHVKKIAISTIPSSTAALANGPAVWDMTPELSGALQHHLRQR